MEKLKVSERFREAALKSNLKEIREMIKSYQSKDYGQELAWACANGLQNVVKCLVDSGANMEYSRGLPLFEAVKSDHLSIVKYLVFNDADVNSDRRPLNEAIRLKNRNMIKFLMECAAFLIEDDNINIEDIKRQFRLDIVKVRIKFENGEDDEGFHFGMSSCLRLERRLQE